MSRWITFRIGVSEILGRYRIWKEAVFVLILMTGLYGCSVLTAMDKNAFYPWEEKKKQILTWAASEKTKVDRGTLVNSKYWEEFYQTSIELRPDLDDFLDLSAEMIKVSRIFEEGKITKQQFEDKKQQLTALFEREENRRVLRCSLPVSGSYDYENILFTCYRESLFLGYGNDLRTRLSAAGPEFLPSHCAFFGDHIKCTTQKAPFLY